MFYYEVIVNSISYQGKEPLTYHYERLLSVGSIVQVAVRGKSILGFINNTVTKPAKFTTKAVERVFELPPLPSEIVKLAMWLPTYYPSGIGVVGQQFLPRSLPQKLETMPETTNSDINTPADPLTKEQQLAIESMRHPNTYILHGETGSGKTRVYIELAKRALDNGRSAIILTPEISLTPQLKHNFTSVFGDRIAVTHSRLTESERRKTWLKILTSEKPLVIIGPRSTLFSPLKNVGLIVMDEAHEPSYKQEQSPHFLTSRVAAKFASLNNATLVLGSATPLITDYYMATERKKTIVRMETVAIDTSNRKTDIRIVDLRNRANLTHTQHLSDVLLTAIQDALVVKEQVLLFLNRRGTAHVILCENCGWQATCSHCDLPLTYHGDSHLMRCHTCGRTWSMAASCPSCQNPNVVLKSIGTKAIYDEVIAAFPEARVQRFDTDNKKTERIEQHYTNIRDGKVDILIGTQLLAKGLDLPKLSVVGVVAADTSLYLPDYTASERTYQLLRQVIGRVGRGHRDGHVIIQTYSPENKIIQAAAKNQWKEFYDQELLERKQFLFPPYRHLLKLTCYLASSARAEAKSNEVVKIIQQHNLRVRIEGPAPLAHGKIHGKYGWQIILKTAHRNELLRTIALLPNGWSFDIDPINLL